VASIAKDLTVAYDPNFNAARFLTAKEVRIGVLPPPLIFSRKVNLQDIQIKSPEINLICAANGKRNFSRIARLHASGGADALLTHNFFERVPAFGQKTRRPLPHARTSLRAQFHDKSGSVDPLLGPDGKHPFIYNVRLPGTTRCPYLYAYAASRS